MENRCNEVQNDTPTCDAEQARAALSGAAACSPKTDQPRGSDGLTKTERAGAYKADREHKGELYGGALTIVFSDRRWISSQEQLATAYKTVNETGRDTFYSNGKELQGKIEVLNYGIHDAVNVIAIDAQGHKHVMLRRVQMDGGQMVQQKGKDGKAVSFESSWWLKNRA